SDVLVQGRFYPFRFSVLYFLSLLTSSTHSYMADNPDFKRTVLLQLLGSCGVLSHPLNRSEREQCNEALRAGVCYIPSQDSPVNFSSKASSCCQKNSGLVPLQLRG